MKHLQNILHEGCHKSKGNDRILDLIPTYLRSLSEYAWISRSVLPSRPWCKWLLFQISAQYNKAQLSCCSSRLATRQVWDGAARRQSATLGTHPSLRNSKKVLSRVFYNRLEITLSVKDVCLCKCSYCIFYQVWSHHCTLLQTY